MTTNKDKWLSIEEETNIPTLIINCEFDLKDGLKAFKTKVACNNTNHENWGYSSCSVLDYRKRRY